MVGASRASIAPTEHSKMLTFLRDLETSSSNQAPTFDVKPALLELVEDSDKLEKCQEFLQLYPKKFADIFCGKLDEFIRSFVTRNECWCKEEKKQTAIILTLTFKLFKALIEMMDRPPNVIYKRLKFFHDNLFIIHHHAEQEVLVKKFLDLHMELSEAWFIKKRSENAYELISNIIVLLLSQKLTSSVLKRLSALDVYWNLFKPPRPDEMSLHGKGLFADLPKEDWESESTETENDVAKSNSAVLDIEKVLYLADAVLKTMSKPELLSSSDGKHFFGVLLTTNTQFVHMVRLALDDIMSHESGEKRMKHLEDFLDVVLRIWLTARKMNSPIKGDIEVFLIVDIMKRSLYTPFSSKKKILEAYRAMVSSMFGRTDKATQDMLHKNFDEMVQEGLDSSNDAVKANSLVMLGRCFPMYGPDCQKAEKNKLVKEQVKAVVESLKSPKIEIRSAAVNAGGELLFRAWGIVDVESRTEIVRQICERLVYDASSVQARLSAVQAISRLIDQPLSQPHMLAILKQMKDVATDEAAQIRMEYYQLILKAVEKRIHAIPGGEQTMNSDVMLLHYMERDVPYTGVITMILDKLLWDLSSMAQFLTRAIELFERNPTVASKIFQNLPKTRPLTDVQLVLNTIFDQVYLAVRFHGAEKQPGVLWTMENKDEMNIALELAGTIWSATVIEISNDEEMNRDVQKKARALLVLLQTQHDKIDPVNLYRIACRLPIEPEIAAEIPVRTYYNYCLQEFQGVTEDNFENGVALMTFLNIWGKSEDVVYTAAQWLKQDTEQIGRKKKATSATKRSHLGLQYLSIALSDTDQSGIFDAISDEVAQLVVDAVEAMTSLVPSRFGAKYDPSDRHVEDAFFSIVPSLAGNCWLNRASYEKDCSALVRAFEEMLISMRKYVFQWVDLGEPANFIYAVQNYKSSKGAASTKNGTSAKETVALADQLVKVCRDLLIEIKALSETNDEELMLQLRGSTNTATAHVHFVTPNVPTVAPVRKAGKRAAASKRGRKS